MVLNNSIVLSSEQKGRIGEDAVCLLFRKLGYKIYRTGIEHTELVNIDRNDVLYRDPLFQQKRKSPDFLMTKGIHISLKSSFGPK
jgi:hypothetical protein